MQQSLIVPLVSLCCNCVVLASLNHAQQGVLQPKLLSVPILCIICVICLHQANQAARAANHAKRRLAKHSTAEVSMHLVAVR